MESAGAALVEAGGVGLRYGDRWVLRGIRLELHAGEVLAVTGPNGSGKSSLLRILSGLAEPTEGKLRLPPRRQRGLASLEQRLYDVLTPAEHCSLVGRLCGVRPPADALEDAGLGDAAGTRAGHLSTGQRARLKLVLATMHAPRLLLLDEPSAGLDGHGLDFLGRIVRRQTAASGCAVLATNDPGDLKHATHRLELAG